MDGPNAMCKWFCVAVAANVYTLVTEKNGTGVLSMKQQQKEDRFSDATGEFGV